MIVFLTAAWAFLKKHATACGFAFIALLGFLFGFIAKKRPVIVSGQDSVKTQAEQQLQTEVAQVDAQAEQEKQQDTEQHTAEVTAVVSSEQQEEASLQNNDDATNSYLKDIGSQVRGGSDGGKQP